MTVGMETGAAVPAALRARLAAEYAPVRPLAAPMIRTLWLVPMALLLLVAAPAWFSVRVDADRLGMAWTWGASGLQVAIGLALVAAGLREAVPGRQWTTAAMVAWLTLPLALLLAVTWSTWAASPILLRRGWWEVGLLCLAGSAVSALPAVVLGAVLAARAFPTRPLATGALIGVGAGLMADAGWRLFCHFSEPAHVVSAHLLGVTLACAMGIGLVRALSRRT